MSSPAFQAVYEDLPDSYSMISNIRGFKLTAVSSYIVEVKNEWGYTFITP
jgi:hypothetical protein